MATVRELITLIGFKVNNAQLNTAEKKVGNFKQKLKQIGMAVAAGIVAIGTAAIKVAGDMESLTASFEVMLGSAEKANELVQELTNFAAKTPFQLQDISEGAKTLLQFGLEADKLMPTLQMLGDVAGNNSQKFKQLTLVFGQIQSTGRLMGQDLLQLINAGFNPLTILAEKTGKTVAQLKDEMSKGAISAEDVAEAFKIATSEGGMFFQNMLKQSKTLAGVWSTLKDNFIITLGQAANEVLPEIKGLLGSLIPIIQETFKPILIDLVRSLVPLFKTLVSLLDPLLRLLMPIIKVLSEVLQAVFKLVDALIPLIETVLEVYLEFMGEVIGGLAGDIIPLFEELAEVIKILTPILQPIIRLLMQILIIFTKLNFFLPGLFFKVMVKGWTLVLKLIKNVLRFLKRTTPIFKIIARIIQGITDFITNIFDAVIEGVFNTIDFVFKMLNKVIEQINKLPFMEETQIQPFDREALEKELIKGGDTTTKNNNINVNNDIDINGGIENKQMMKKALQKTAGTVFNIKLKELIIDAGGL